ncbi:hypothetical protein NL676_016319 [Syzygium grande]|nr:hypothetical protein NL676_016319 [Syzygium grande]
MIFSVRIRWESEREEQSRASKKCRSPLVEINQKSVPPTQVKSDDRVPLDEAGAEQSAAGPSPATWASQKRTAGLRTDGAFRLHRLLSFFAILISSSPSSSTSSPYNPLRLNDLHSLPILPLYPHYASPLPSPPTRKRPSNGVPVPLRTGGDYVVCQGPQERELAPRPDPPPTPSSGSTPTTSAPPWSTTRAARLPSGARPSSSSCPPAPSTSPTSYIDVVHAAPRRTPSPLLDRLGIEVEVRVREKRFRAPPYRVPPATREHAPTVFRIGCAPPQPNPHYTTVPPAGRYANVPYSAYNAPPPQHRYGGEPPPAYGQHRQEEEETSRG